MFDIRTATGALGIFACATTTLPAPAQSQDPSSMVMPLATMAIPAPRTSAADSAYIPPAPRRAGLPIAWIAAAAVAGGAAGAAIGAATWEEGDCEHDVGGGTWLDPKPWSCHDYLTKSENMVNFGMIGAAAGGLLAYLIGNRVASVGPVTARVDITPRLTTVARASIEF